MVVLQDFVAGQAGRCGQAPGPLHPPRPVVAHPQQADGAFGDQFGEALDRLLQRHRRILDVRIQQIQPRHAEPFPASLRGLPDHLGRQPLGVVSEAGARGQWPRPELGGDDDLVSDTAAAAPAAEQLLALSALTAVDPERVVVRGVDEGPAGLDIPVEDRERRRLVDGRAEQHAPKAQHAHLAACPRVLADRGVSHTGSSHTAGQVRALSRSLHPRAGSRSTPPAGEPSDRQPHSDPQVTKIVTYKTVVHPVRRSGAPGPELSAPRHTVAT